MSMNASLAFALLCLTAASPTLAGPETQTAAIPPKAIVEEADARRIAWSHGLVHIEEIGLHADRWEIAGRNRSGLEMTLDIGAKDGAVAR